jgi:hypothetical protein
MTRRPRAEVVMCKDDRHYFEKFDDSRIFCRNCGEVRTVPATEYQTSAYDVENLWRGTDDIGNPLPSSFPGPAHR